MSSPTEGADRRTRALRLWSDGASTRSVAAELGISKDTVLRDVEDAPRTVAVARAAKERAARIETAPHHLGNAVSGIRGERPGYAMTDERTAADWASQPRWASGQLAELADQFTDYYPHTQQTPPNHQPEQ